MASRIEKSTEHLYDKEHTRELNADEIDHMKLFEPDEYKDWLINGDLHNKCNTEFL